MIQSIPFVNDTSIDGSGAYALWGGEASYGVIGVEVLCDDQYVGFPSSLQVQWRCNGGAWNATSTDSIGPSNNYRAFPVTQSGNYDVRLLNTNSGEVTIKAGVIVRVTVA